MTFLVDETIPARDVYDVARRWLAEAGLPRRLDNHQVWAIVEQRYPGGWTAFTSVHQEQQP